MWRDMLLCPGMYGLLNEAEKEEKRDKIINQSINQSINILVFISSS